VFTRFDIPLTSLLVASFDRRRSDSNEYRSFRAWTGHHLSTSETLVSGAWNLKTVARKGLWVRVPRPPHSGDATLGPTLLRDPSPSP